MSCITLCFFLFGIYFHTEGPTNYIVEAGMAGLATSTALARLPKKPYLVCRGRCCIDIDGTHWWWRRYEDWLTKKRSYYLKVFLNLFGTQCCTYWISLINLMEFEFGNSYENFSHRYQTPKRTYSIIKLSNTSTTQKKSTLDFYCLTESVKN